MAKASQNARNSGLETLLEQARWSRTQFANAVNRIAAQIGISLKYDQSAVSHWVAGTQPREQARPVIVEALERRLGRPVTYEEAGLRPPKGGRGSDSADTVESLLDLGKADMDPSRRGVLAVGLYSAALAVPLFAGEARAAERERSTRPTTHVGAGEVATVRTMTDRIADILDELGGGHARPMAAAFLVNTVAPYLRASASEQVRKDMLSAASDLTYLTGWMAMFEREHGLGQRYYIKALKIAREAADHLTYCRTLRGMSLQASNLGYGQKALELADSAAEAAPQAAPVSSPFFAANRHTQRPWSAPSARRSPGCARPSRRCRRPTPAGSPSGGTTRPRTSSMSPMCSMRPVTCPARSRP